MPFVIKVENIKTGAVRYAAPNGGGVERRENARVFESRQQTDHVASQILRLVAPRGFVTIEEES